MNQEDKKAVEDLKQKVEKEDHGAKWGLNSRSPIGLCSKVETLKKWGDWRVSTMCEAGEQGRLFIALGYEMKEKTTLGNCLKGLKLYYFLKQKEEEKGKSCSEFNDGVTPSGMPKFNWNLKLFIEYHKDIKRENWTNYDEEEIVKWIINQKNELLKRIESLSNEIHALETMELSNDVKRDTAKWYLGNKGKYNNNMSDEELLNCYEKEVKSTNKDTTAAGLRENHSKTEQKKDMANDDMSQKEGYFTLRQVQEFFNRFGRTSQNFFSSNIKITGVTYDRKKLERAESISRDGTTEKITTDDAMRYMTADIYFMLTKNGLVLDDEGLRRRINGSREEHSHQDNFPLGEDGTVTLRTNIGAGNLLSNLAQTFVPEITKALPEKLEFSYIWKVEFPDLLMDWLDITHEKQSTREGQGVSDPKHPRNCIWAGAPGTGKSNTLNREAHNQFGAENIMRVTFHPEYTYYDFVGTYRPRMAKDDEGNTLGKIEYAFVPGPFAKMLKRALWNRNANYCLIIEEINRANAAAVFGDVFQLLDRASQNSEDGSVRMHESEYAICPSEELYEYLMNKQEGNKEMSGTRPSAGIMNELRLPANLYIWATMNSADQGVFPMDTAFKRRWSFENMAINPSEGQDPDYNPESAWDKIRRGINDMLLKHHVQEDKLMGYYFLKKEERDSKENLEKALKEKVLLYLFEDAAKPFRGKIFKNEYNTCEKLRGKLGVDDPNLGVFLEKVWDGIPQQSKPEDTKLATEDVGNDDNP